ncbi:MAG: hypothetical protein IPM42_01555 [Saprospiraceae bacterium]|nr:hypothetical protein [Saprospiraceae bacterium]
MLATLPSYGQVSGYSFSQSSGTYTPIVGGINIPSTTAATLDDNVYGNLPIGFSFNYNGTNYTEFGINANGWINLGSTLPTNSNTALSSGSTNNVIAPLNNDLIGRIMLTGNRTSGSSTVTITSGDITQLSIGDGITGTGIPSGTTITSISGSTIIMSANASSSGTGFNVRICKTDAGIRYQTMGMSPNRQLVIQWTGFNRYATNGAFGEVLNFQIILNETSNSINLIYNILGPSSTSTVNYQIGLRGSNNSDFNNRSTTTDWAATLAGGINTATVALSNTIKPSIGLTFTWAPPSCIAPTGLNNANLTSTTATIGWSAVPSATGGYDWELRSIGACGSGSPLQSGNSTTTSVNLTGLTANTSYIYCVRSVCDGPSNSGWASSNFFTGYCLASSTSQASWISAFSTTGGSTNISHTAGVGATGGYADLTATDIVSNYIGNATNFSITSGGPTVGNAIWVDWNNNLIFESGERMYVSSGYGTTVTGSFAVPAATPNGNYRMRVITDWNISAPSNPCGNIDRGEYKDFTFTVIDQPAACVAPIDQPTDFTTGSNTVSAISGSFTAATSAPSGYLVVRSIGALDTNPVDGTLYAANASLGNGTVIQSNANLTFTGTGLQSNTAYTITIFSYNNTSCSGGPAYLTTSPLSGTLTTCPAAPTAAVNSAISTDGFTVSWTASAVGGSAGTINYTVEVYEDSGFTMPVTGSPFDAMTNLNQAVSGLDDATTYYYRIFANNGSCNSNYLTGSVFTGYCLASSTSQASWISAFSTTGGSTNISHTAGVGASGGYADLTATDIVSNYIGNATNFSITSGGPTVGNAIWVDWNNNLIFESGERMYVSSGYGTTVTGSFAVPAATPNGNYRIRVITDFNMSAPSNPCGNITRGEYKDFTFTVIDQPAACVAPADQPTDFTSGTNTATTISGSFTAAVSVPSGYLVVRSIGVLDTDPVDGTIYAPNASLGNGTVIQSNANLTFSGSGLQSNTAYTITIFSYNNTACSGGPAYLTTSPLSGTLTTCPVAPTAAVNSAISTDGFTVSWTASAVGGSAGTINYTVEVYEDSGFTMPVTGSPFDAMTNLNQAVTGLDDATTYYYRIFANNGSCNSTFLTGNVMTLCNAENAPTAIQTFATFTGAAPAPACWSEATGTLAVSTTLSGTTSAWLLKANGFANITSTNPGASINLYSTKNDWIISQPIDLGVTPSQFRVSYNMAVTNWDGTSVQSTLGTHKVDIVVSTDGGTTWSNSNVIKTYTGVGTYSNTGQIETIDLIGYSGIVKIAFVATTTVISPDIDFHIDDFKVEAIPMETIDWGNLQWPPSGSIYPGQTYDTYGQAYKAGITDPAGQAPGLDAWIGYNNADTDPETWTNWIPASFNTEAGNNDEFIGTFTANTFTPGTYYYAYRYQYNGGPFRYGGYSPSPGGGFWDGTTYVSGVLTVNPCPTFTPSASPLSICAGGSSDLSVSSGHGSYTYSWDPGSFTGGGPHNVTPSSTTTYTVIATDGSISCTNTGTVTVTVNPLPVITSVTAAPNNFCSGGNSQLEVVAASSAKDFVFAATSGSFTPLVGGVDVNSIEADDAISTAIPIGFPFTFAGTTYSNAYASSNGFLSFNASATTTAGNNLTSPSSTLLPLLAPLWDDLDGRATGGSQARYLTDGISPNQVFTIEWLNWEWNYQSTAAVISFQIKLYEADNRIEFVYRQEAGAYNAGSTGGASIGITSLTGNFLSLNNTSASPTASSTTETSNLNTKPATGQIYTFTPPSYSYAWSPSTFLSSTNISNPMANAVTTTTEYTAQVTDQNSCTNTMLVSVNVEGTVVKNSGNAGFNSLRNVYDCITEGGTITYDQPATDESLLTVPLDITKSVTIQGLGPDDGDRPMITIPGVGLNISSGKTLTLDNVDVTSSGVPFEGTGTLVIKEDSKTVVQKID